MLKDYKNCIDRIYELKKEIDRYRPLNKQQLQELKEYYRIGLTYTSNALEGNSLTETETKIVLEEGITIGGKSLNDHLETLGHSDAYYLLLKLATYDTIREKDIRDLHKLFYFRINQKTAGKYRKKQVFITGTEFIPPAPEKIRTSMHDFIEEIPVIKQQNNPVVYAALLHLKLVTIHPFVDGNGRCARLLMNLALMQAGYPITIIPPVVRTDYINAIKIYQTTSNQEPFIAVIATMVYESEQEYLRLVRALTQQ
jgi:Fic family protein